MLTEYKMQAVESILKMYGECPWLDPGSNSYEEEEDEIVSMNSVESILKMDGEWPWLNPSPNSWEEEEDEIVSLNSIDTIIQDIKWEENIVPLLPKEYKYKPIDLFFKPMEAGEDSSGSLDSMKRTRRNTIEQNTSRQKGTMATEI